MSFLDFLWRKPITIEHPEFGRITLERGKDGPNWMQDAYAEDELSVSIATLGDAPPTVSQAEFFNNIVGDHDRAFAQAAELIIPRYEQFFGRTFPEQWRLALELCGVGVPLHGSETHPWHISFECLTDNTGHIFTCYFVNGLPSHVSLDT